MHALSAAASRYARRVAAREWPGASRAAHAVASSTYDSLQRTLAAVARPIAVRGDDVRVLASPADFVEALHAGFASARRRITLASLYLGVEAPAERALLDALAAAVAARPELDVLVLLDALRGTRPVPDGRGGVTSSAAALSAALLARGGGNRVRVALYHAPSLRGPLARAAHALPPRAREIAGVCHVKAAVFDDDALWTGANLAETYLTQRQDRYVLFQRSSALADATVALVEAIAAQSYELCADGSLSAHRVRSPPRAAAAALASALGSLVEPVTAAPPTASHDTWVHLTAQAGFAGLRHDERVVHSLLTAAPEGGTVALATPYCNLAPATERALGSTRSARLEMLTAAPEAHGFAGAAGVAAVVPSAYGVMEHRLLSRLLARPGATDVTLLEYARPGWQFHAKGVWLWPAPGQDGLAQHPVACVVGSSNYGMRSSRRDVEAQLALLTRHAGLRAALGAEWAALAAAAPPVALPQLEARRHGIGARIAAHAARRWM